MIRAGRHGRPLRRRRQHPRDRARGPDHGAGREQLPARAHARARHRRPVRLRRPPHHRDDRAPQDRPRDGELHFFGYGFAPPFLTYHRLSAAGELVTSAEIAVPGPTMMHDFAITDRHAVFLDLPMTFSLDRLRDRHALRLGRRVRRPDRPHAARPARRGDVVRRRPRLRVPRRQRGHRRRRAGSSSTPPATRPPTPSRCGTGSGRAPPGPPPRRPPAASPGCTAGCSTRRPAPSPRPARRPARRVPDRRRRARRPGRPLPLRRRHVRRGEVRRHRGRGRPSTRSAADTVAGEAVFVPSAAPDRAEDDGWLLTITTRRDGSASQLLVLDATDVAGAPVAAVTLPRGRARGLPRVLDPRRRAELSESRRRAAPSARLMLRGLAGTSGCPSSATTRCTSRGCHDFVALLVASRWPPRASSGWPCGNASSTRSPP